MAVKHLISRVGFGSLKGLVTRGLASAEEIFVPPDYGEIFMGEFSAHTQDLEQELYASGAPETGKTTEVSDTPASTFFPAVISRLAGPSRSMFQPRMTEGQSGPAVGDVYLNNPEGKLDRFRRYAFDGRPAIVRRGPFFGAYPATYRTILNGTMSAPEWDTNGVRLRIRDAQKYASKDLQPSRYTGAGGLNGDTSLKDKKRPHLTGASAFNVPVVCVDPVKNIYEAHDGLLSNIASVSEDGLSFVTGASDWTNVSASRGGRAIDTDGAGTVMMVDLAGVVHRSTDYGATFSTVTAFTADDLFAIRWWAAQSLWITGGEAGTLYTSPTGATGTWTSRTSNFSGDAIYDIDVSSTIAVIVGGNGKLSSSPTGVTWTARTSQFAALSLDIYAVTCAQTPSGDKWLAVGEVSGASKSEDGITWVTAAASISVSPGGETFLGVANNGFEFIIVAATSIVYSTVDRTNFTQTHALNSAPFLGSNINTVSYANGQFVFGSSAGHLAVSKDGRDIRITKTPDGVRQYFGIVFTGVTWLACSQATIVDKAAAVSTYASSADLQDNTLAPPIGSWKMYLSANGSYFRLGSPPIGVITCVPERTFAGNRILHSEDFSQADWSKTNVTVTTNSTTAPNGAATADKIEATASAATSTTQSFVVGAGVTSITYSIYAKKGSNAAQGNEFGLYNSSTASDLLFVSVNYDTGVVTTDAGVGVASMKKVAGAPGWWRISLTVNSGVSVGNTVFVYAGFDTSPAAAGEFVYLWGAQVDGRPFATKYVATTSVVVNANASAAVCAWDELSRTGLVATDISSEHFTALDEMTNAVLGDWFGPDDESILVGDVIGRICETVGSGWWANNAGQLCLGQLRDPEGPYGTAVTVPDHVANSPWVAFGGSISATNAADLKGGRYFARVNNANTGILFYPVEMDYDGDGHIRMWLSGDTGVAGTIVVGWHDDTASAFRVTVTITVDAQGNMTLTSVSAGTVVQFAQETTGDATKVYSLWAKGTGGIAANDNRLHVSMGSGSATSYLVSNVRFLAGDADAQLDQDDEAVEWFDPVPSANDNEGVPPLETVLLYAKNYHVQTTNIAAAVSNTAKTRLGLEWLQAKDDSGGVGTVHLSALPRTIPTMFLLEADAQAECERRQILDGRYHEWAILEVNSSEALEAVDIDQTLDYSHERHLLAGGGRFRVMGVDPLIEDDKDRITFTLWR